MPYQHTKNPYDLGDDNYGEYCGKLKDFLEEENSMPRRPTYYIKLNTKFALLIDHFELIFFRCRKTLPLQTNLNIFPNSNGACRVIHNTQ